MPTKRVLEDRLRRRQRDLTRANRDRDAALASYNALADEADALRQSQSQWRAQSYSLTAELNGIYATKARRWSRFAWGIFGFMVGVGTLFALLMLMYLYTTL